MAPRPGSFVLVAVAVSLAATALAVPGLGALPSSGLDSVPGIAPAAGPDTAERTPPDAPPPERWNRTYGPAAGDLSDVTTANGTWAVGAVLTAGGTDRDGFLVRVGPDGHERWNRTYGGGDDDSLAAIAATPDGGAILAGTTASRGAGGEDGWILKVGPNGSVEWRLVTGGPGDDAFAAVTRTDGGYLVAGTRSTGVETDGWLVAVGEGGTTRWLDTYDGGADDSFAAVRVTDAGVLAAGTTDVLADRAPDGWLVSTTTDGTERWQRRYGGPRADRIRALRPTEEGPVLAGSTRSDGRGRRGWLVAAAPDGTERWNRSYDAARIAGFAPADGGGFLLASATRPGTGLPDGQVLAVDDAGTPVWNATYGGSNFETLSAVTRTGDGGYVFAGTSASGETPGTHWLLKLGGDPVPVTATVTPTPPGSTPAGSPTRTPTAVPTPDPGAPPPVTGTTRTTTGSAAGGNPLVALLAVLVGFVAIVGGSLLALRLRGRSLDEDALPGVTRLREALGVGADASGARSTATNETAGASEGVEADEQRAAGDGDAGAGAGAGESAASSASPPVTPETAEAGDPGVFTLTNVDDAPVVCRFRCQTRDGVEFDHWVELEAGATRRSRAIPATAPFQIAIKVEDGPTDSRIFRNDGSSGTDVLVRVSEEAVSIERA